VSGGIASHIFVGFEVLTAVIMKSTIFWDITPCSLLRVNRRFGGTYCLHLQGRRISWARSQHESRWQDGGDMFFRNVGWLSMDYTELYPRRWYFSHVLVCFYLNSCYVSVPIRRGSLFTTSRHILRLQAEETESRYVCGLFCDAVDIGADGIEW
jgi:hypothetical protein